MRNYLKRVRTWVIPICLTLFVFLLMKAVFLFGYVPTASMEPTLPEGSYILGLRIYGELEKGDIIVFQHDGKLLVKRIAALPGEEIRWDELSYADSMLRPNREECCTKVPEGCFLVLGDNAEVSYDSRYWADPFVSESDVVAKLILPT